MEGNIHEACDHGRPIGVQERGFECDDLGWVSVDHLHATQKERGTQGQDMALQWTLPWSICPMQV